MIEMGHFWLWENGRYDYHVRSSKIDQGGTGTYTLSGDQRVLSGGRNETGTLTDGWVRVGITEYERAETP